MKARQGLNEQINTIASSVLTIEPKHGAGGQLSPGSSSHAASDSDTEDHTQQQLHHHHHHDRHDEADTDGLVDVPLSTPAVQHPANTRPASRSSGKEAAALKARLAVVEEAAAEALGELQDLRDELEAHKGARHAAERQVCACV